MAEKPEEEIRVQTSGYEKKMELNIGAFQVITLRLRK